jgi:hypothetical protein
MYRDGMEVVEENIGIGGLPLTRLLRGGGRRSTRIGIDGGTYRAKAMETALEGTMIEITIENLFKNEVLTVNTTIDQDQENIQAENLYEGWLPGTNGTNLAILLIEVGRS